MMWTVIGLFVAIIIITCLMAAIIGSDTSGIGAMMAVVIAIIIVMVIVITIMKLKGQGV